LPGAPRLFDLEVVREIVLGCARLIGVSERTGKWRRFVSGTKYWRPKQFRVGTGLRQKSDTTGFRDCVKNRISPLGFVRDSSCDFVDRTFFVAITTIHEITRTITNKTDG
ncbi:MAG TPA: hypothetical protein VKB46_25745, partial [Pyrinomonadaceae bacterium]|nr:hypothetical protein [Pyrinomonadaceae bacterium]